MSMMDVMTDGEVVREIGSRLRAYRLLANVGVAEVAARAGLNRNTVLRSEAGANPRIGTVVRILRALGRLDAVDAFLPAPAVSPLQLLRTGGQPRRRARRKGAARG